MQATSRLFLLAITLCIMVCSHRSLAYQRLMDSEEFDLPSYALLIDSADQYQVSCDSVFYEHAASIVFRVNRTRFTPGDPVVLRLQRELLPLLEGGDWVLAGIDVRGAASPEDTYQRNTRLARGRAQRLADLLSEQLDSAAMATVTVTAIPEDYAYLEYMMEQNGDPAAPQVAGIIAQYTLDNPAAIKAALRQADGGRLWQRMLWQYYPQMRNARMVVLLRRVARDVYELSEAAEWKDPTPMMVEEAATALWQEAPATEAAQEWARMSAPRQHMLAVSTNLLYDMFYMPQYGWAPMPNVGIEFFPRSGQWTLRGQFLFPYYHKWGKNKFFQIRDYHVEVRRYFRPGLWHTGWYLALYANVNKYGIGLSARKGWQGEGWGGALRAGYVWRLGGRWRIEAHAAVGGYVTRYDPYVYGNPITGEVTGNDREDYYYDYTGDNEDFRRRNHRFSWLGPTDLGITISYDLAFHKRRRHSY